MKLRIARATNDLYKISKMYTEGLNFQVLGSFQNHAGFDGVMLGKLGVDYHFEFTQEQSRQAPLSHSEESLIVFYTGDLQTNESYKNQMIKAGFKVVKSHNPYWDQNGVTLEDLEGYRIVLCHQKGV
jgi:hypothetical protein